MHEWGLGHAGTCGPCTLRAAGRDAPLADPNATPQAEWILNATPQADGIHQTHPPLPHVARCGALRAPSRP